MSDPTHHPAALPVGLPVPVDDGGACHLTGMTLIKRMAGIIDDGVITHLLNPMFPPDQNVEEVIAWLQASRA